MSREERFANKTTPAVDCDCLLWTGAVNKKSGYGYFMWEKKEGKAKNILAHRAALLLIGVDLGDLHVDHVRERGCRYRHCVNTDHLEPVTQAENNRRIGAALTHCKRANHEYTPENTLLTKQPNGRTSRKCRECHNARLRGPEAAAKQRARRARRKNA